MIKHLCNHPGCMNTVNNKGDYCPEHSNSNNRQDDRRVNNYGSSKKTYAHDNYKHLYNSSAWRKLRQLVWQRDSYTCQLCGATDTQLVADHVQPHRGNTDLFYEMDNLVTLCKACHDYKTRQEIIKRKKEKARERKREIIK